MGVCAASARVGLLAGLFVLQLAPSRAPIANGSLAYSASSRRPCLPHRGLCGHLRKPGSDAWQKGVTCLVPCGNSDRDTRLASAVPPRKRLEARGVLLGLVDRFSNARCSFSRSCSMFRSTAPRYLSDNTSPTVFNYAQVGLLACAALHRLG